MINWHILTGEYPPKPGGVSDYSQMVTDGLVKAGDTVHVWSPSYADSTKPYDGNSGVEVHWLPDRFGPRSLAVISKALKKNPQPIQLLVQYVPHAFGWKAMNIPFCLWLYWQRRESLIVFFHEVAFPFNKKQPLAHNVLGVVTRIMAALVARSAKRVFVSIPAWKIMLKSLAPKHQFVTWLPIPSNVPIINDPDKVATIRSRYTPEDGFLIGHFGTYGKYIAAQLKESIPHFLSEHRDRAIVLLGRGSEGLRDELIRKYPDLSGWVNATGALSLADISIHLSACDVMFQPYPDGVSSRRTSVMAGLSHGLPILTTSGHLTEHLWAESSAVKLAPVGDVSSLVQAMQQLLDDAGERRRLGSAARTLYQERFDIRRTITALRESVI